MFRPAINEIAYDLPFPAAIKFFLDSDALVFHNFLNSMSDLPDINNNKHEKNKRFQDIGCIGADIVNSGIMQQKSYN